MQKYTDSYQTAECSSIDLTTEENYLLQEELENIGKDVTAENSLSQLVINQQTDAGHARLLETSTKFFNNYFNPLTQVLNADIATAAGAVEAIDALLSSICEQGDGVLIPVGSDLRIRHRSFFRPIEIDMTGLCSMSSKAIMSRLTIDVQKVHCRIRALILTNPHKTLGHCYSQDMLEGCLKFCQSKDIHFISDEEYALTAFSCAEITEPHPFISALSLNTRALKCDRARIHTIWSIDRGFGAGKYRLSFTVTQGNPKLISQLTERQSSQASVLSTAFTTALLSSPTFPFLITLNSARLAEAYMLITEFFTRRNVAYIPVSGGSNIFARLAPRAKTWEDENLMIEKLRGAGVLVTSGQNYSGRPKAKGWVRLSFSVEPKRLQEALKRVDAALGISMRSTM
ncbi:hypothetical protein LOZ65_000485 [Ophidiomyces ophidiicola]|nr:hypothetical protein LOZ65_000485 [Ophidiomyces ophidiicola]